MILGCPPMPIPIIGGEYEILIIAKLEKNVDI
jgi:hypothetical protein